MAQQELKLELRGLYTAPNSLSSVPDGALVVAQNVVIDQYNVLQSRRGQKQYGVPLNLGLGQINKIFNYKSNLLINYTTDDTFTLSNRISYDPGDGYWVQYDGYFAPPSADYKMRSVELNKNCYFTTDKGIQKIDLITNNPRQAGIVPALSGTGVTSGSSGFLVDNSAVAYRLVWSYFDVNGNLIRSAPSSRLIVRNATGGDRDVSLTFIIPDTITQEYKYSIFRSFGTLTAAGTPNDDLLLALQDNPTPAQIAAKSFTVLDTTPTDLLGELIYTAEAFQGISQANYEPPLCTDMDVFKECVFYGNTQAKEQQTITLITAGFPGFGFLNDPVVSKVNSSVVLNGITSTAGFHIGMSVDGVGIQTGTTIRRINSSTSVQISKPANATNSSAVNFRDVIIIDNIEYKSGSANDPSLNIFKVETAFTPGDNISFTAQNLVEVINKSTTNTTVYAYYESQDDDLPGRIKLEARKFGQSPFEITSSGGQAFVPNLSFGLPITGITTSSPPQVLTFTTAGLNDGDIVTITGSNSTPSLDGDWTISVLTATRFEIISPPITITSSGTTGSWIVKNKIVTSTKEEFINRVYVSKPSQPEAVPLLNYFPVGSANYPIDRVIALRDGIFFLKEDGIFQTSGNTIGNFSTVLVDNTVTVICPESAVVFNNQIYCMTTQGICAISDSGVKIISIPIENLLSILSSERFPNFRNKSFAISYESDRQYIFYTVNSPSDEFATHAYVYNYVTESFVEWTGDRTCGLVNNFTGNKLFLAKPTVDGYGQVLIERKTYTSSDFADEQFNIVITAINSTTELEFTSQFPIEAGMTIQQVDRRVIASVTDGYIITLTEPTQFFELGDAQVFKPIRNRITWAPIMGGNPGIHKQFYELILAFQSALFSSIDISYTTNFENIPITYELANRTNIFGWGMQPWGVFPWGDSVSGGQVFIRTYIPKPMQRCITLNLSLELNEAFRGFQLQGVSLMWNPGSSMFRS